MPPIHGRCLCGGVEFEIAGPLMAPLIVIAPRRRPSRPIAAAPGVAPVRRLFW